MPPLSSDFMRDRPIEELLLKLSLPSIIGLVLQMTYSLTDSFFVALWIGDRAVAALAVAFPVQLVIVAFAQGFGIGGGTLIGRYLGSNEIDHANIALKNTLLMTGITSMSLSASIFLFLPEIVSYLGASHQSAPMSISYTSVVLLGAPFLSFSIATNSIARAEGQATVAMKTLAISSLVNVILDPIFIKIMGMGVSGAAWATVISQAGSALWMGFYLAGNSSLSLTRPYFKINLIVMSKIMSIGSSAFVRQGAGSITTAFLNRLLATMGGDPAVAAMGVLGRITTFAYMPLFGIVQGMMPIVSHNIGAAADCRVLRAINLSILWGTVVCLTGAIPLIAIPGHILAYFSSGETLRAAMEASPYMAMSMPLAGFQVVLSGTYQAMGKGKIAFLLDLTRRTLVVVPLAWALSRLHGVMGVFWAFPLTEVISGFTSLWMFRSVRIKLIKACHDNRP